MNSAALSLLHKDDCMIGQLKQSLCSNGDVRDGEEGKRREREEAERSLLHSTGDRERDREMEKE